MTDIITELENRGYIEQLTHEEEIKDLFKKESVSSLPCWLWKNWNDNCLL